MQQLERWMRRRLLWVALVAALGSLTTCSQGPPRSDAALATIQRFAARGQILLRSLGQDPSQQYLLYVPPRAVPGAHIFVTVHGISRNLEEHATLFAPFAEEHGVVLVAPFFTRDRNDGYQRLEKGKAGQRADLILNAIIDEVSNTLGADGRKFYLFGFSGGAQFAHRYAMAHPDRVFGVVVGAAGWYTFPDPKTPYPYGLGASSERSNLRFDPGRFLHVPFTVLVGGDDVQGGESLRRNEFVDVQQGTTRLERARRWVDAMNRAAKSRGLPPPATYYSVPGIEHSFGQFMRKGGLGERVFDTLFQPASAGAHP